MNTWLSICYFAKNIFYQKPFYICQVMSILKLTGFVLLAFLGLLYVSHPTTAKDLGKLECNEKDGLKPDSKLLNLIISKCQPKQGQPEKMIAACMVKCLMKQQKAVDKKGKLKMKEAIEIVNIFPDQFKENITEKFHTCAKENNDKLKKEPNGCESWLPFSECFYAFGQSLCPSEKTRNKWATSTTTEAASSTSA